MSYIKEWILDNPGELVLKTSKQPKKLEDDSVRVETYYSALSIGTELAAYTGMVPLRPVKHPYPRKVGYCNVGRIVAKGSNITGHAIGELVYSNASHCSHYDLPSSDILISIPESGFGPSSALCYLYHLGSSALLASQLKTGCSSVFLGGGNLSLHAAQIFYASGIQVDLVSSFDCTPGLPIGSNVYSREDTVNLSGKYDAAIVFTNSWNDYLLALKLVNFKGTIVLVGFPGRGQPANSFNPLDSQYVYDKQLTIRACGKNDVGNAGRQDFKDRCRYILESISSGLLNSDVLLDDVVSWKCLPQIYSELSEGRSRLGTVVLDWQGA